MRNQGDAKPVVLTSRNGVCPSQTWSTIGVKHNSIGSWRDHFLQPVLEKLERDWSMLFGHTLQRVDGLASLSTKSSAAKSSSCPPRESCPPGPREAMSWQGVLSCTFTWRFFHVLLRDLRDGPPPRSVRPCRHELARISFFYVLRVGGSWLKKKQATVTSASPTI